MSKKKIAIFVLEITNEIKFENVVSAHVQLPLKTASMLVESGHSVTLLTNKQKDLMRTFPSALHPDIIIQYVTDPMVRNEKSVMLVGREQNKGSVINLARVIKQIVFFCKKQSIDVLHLFGSEKVGFLSGLVNLFLNKTKVVWTSNVANFPVYSKKYHNWLLSNVDLFLTSTSFVYKQANNLTCTKSIARHGVLRDFALPVLTTKPNRVLFWRDPSFENGADLCAEAYRILAPRYPDVHFDFAIRPHWSEIESIKEIENDFKNVSVYRFPYRQGITIESLLAGSLVCVFPFRKLSVNPQWAILETITAGIPVIVSDISSNNEIIGDADMLLKSFNAYELAKLIEIYIVEGSPKIYEQNNHSDIWCWSSYYSNIIRAYHAE